MAEAAPPIAATPRQWAIVRAILRCRIPEREVRAFGSRAGGRPGQFSDLDLLVCGEEPLPLGILGELREAFSDSDLPWRVDVIEAAETSASFRALIEPTSVVVQSGACRN